jgi:hypothetical protein
MGSKQMGQPTDLRDDDSLGDGWYALSSREFRLVMELLTFSLPFPPTSSSSL